ncbi:ISL3 family transposase [Candidatus Poriferisodalis sp.]|uniref:ISL3 family transposase n=1 Tax=Candidatus Poriferisodalis sp. TaxID=3101277 RepID=UPI003C7023E2
MASDVMSVRLWLPCIKVLEVVADAPEWLAVRVASTVSRPRCCDCGTPGGRCHDRREQKIRDLGVSGRPVLLLWVRRRMVCDVCGRRFLEDHRAFEGKVTARVARRLVADARLMPVNAVAGRHKVGWHTVMALVAAYAGLVARHRRRRRCRVLLVDETSIRKRHRYVTVLVNGDTGEVLAMVPHRPSQALSAFLAAQGHKWCRGVKVVVSDGSRAYKAAIDQRLGHARHVLDRFHVIRWFGAGLTAVRRDVQRRPEGSKPAFDRDVFRARFLLMRRPDKLDAADQARLDALFAAHPRLKSAWDARSASCTASISPRTPKARWPRSTGSPTSTAPG